jgi:DNA integrity scanning protein DisA with diadenylate cyclase activity
MIQKLTEQLATLFELAVNLAKAVKADALLVLVEAPLDWDHLKKLAGKNRLVIAAEDSTDLEGIGDADLPTVVINLPGAPISEKLTQALLESVADDMLAPGADVIALYSGFEAGQIDSLSLLRLDEHLGRLTARDLRKLETTVPLETLKTVVDLAVDIGREGREGKPVGTMFVVGDHRNVLQHARPLGFDPVFGYTRKERNLLDGRVREAIKEIAPLDGAFIIAADGVVVAACQMLQTGGAGEVNLSRGLGTRHAAAATITKMTKSIAVAVSESGGTVRLFQNGEVVLRIEPFRRAMKWKDFEYEPPLASSDD